MGVSEKARILKDPVEARHPSAADGLGCHRYARFSQGNATSVGIDHRRARYVLSVLERRLGQLGYPPSVSGAGIAAGAAPTLPTDQLSLNLRASKNA